MTLDRARKKIKEAVKGIYEEGEAANIAVLLLEYLTKLERQQLVLKKDAPLPAEEIVVLDMAIQRLRDHEPVQYITGEAWFAGMNFYVDKNVLIPRPETEELLNRVITDLKTGGLPATLIDVGTGSGCLAIGIKRNLSSLEILACDVSDKALEVARLNAGRLDADIAFIRLDFLNKEERHQLPRLDVIVSNPPYVLQENARQMRRNVVEFEPRIALFVPNDDPLVFYKALAEFGKEKLNARGRVFAEIHEDFGDAVKSLFSMYGYASVLIHKDFQGKDRMLTACTN